MIHIQLQVGVAMLYIVWFLTFIAFRPNGELERRRLRLREDRPDSDADDSDELLDKGD